MSVGMITRTPISGKLASGQNSFGFLRLIAATAVVLSHAWTVTGGATAMEPFESSTGFALGWHAVNLFFALSGILIAASLDNGRSLARFTWSRFLRIFPALIVVVLATLTVAAIMFDSSLWHKVDVLEFLARNFLLIGASATLPGVFEGNPIPGEINIPLWTLKYEVVAYATIALLSFLSWRVSAWFTPKLFSLLVLVTTATVMLTFGGMETYGKMEHAIRLLFAFYLGVAAWHWRDTLSANIMIVAFLGLFNAVLLWVGISYMPVQIVFVAYFGLWLGVQDFGAITSFTDKQDYSYGIYIIGYPVQQSVLAVTGSLEPWLNFAITMPILVALAAVSWNWVEKPALELKNAGFFKRRNNIPLSKIQRIGLKL